MSVGTQLDRSEPTRQTRYLAKFRVFQPLDAPLRYLTDRSDYFWYGCFRLTVVEFVEFQDRLMKRWTRSRAQRAFRKTSDARLDPRNIRGKLLVLGSARFDGGIPKREMIPLPMHRVINVENTIA